MKTEGIEKQINDKIESWRKEQGWACSDPFIHSTDVRLFTGFEDILEKIYMFIEMGQNYAVLYGDYGFGKTMILKKICHDLLWKYNIVYFEEPVSRDEIYKELLKNCSLGFFSRLLGKKPGIKDYEKLGNCIEKRTVLVFDEAHSLNEAAFSYLRSLSENSNKFSIIFAGKPEIISMESEKRLPQYLIDRLKLSLPLRVMTDSEAVELIKKRVRFLADSENYLFDDDAIKYLAHKSKYVPREILENASSFVEYAIERGIHRIDVELIERKFTYVTRKQEEVSQTYLTLVQEAKAEVLDRNTFLKELSPLQRRIVEALFKHGKMSTPMLAELLGEDSATIRHMMHRLQGKYDELRLRPRIAHLYPLVIAESVKGVRGNVFSLTHQARKVLSTD
ncbi:hypothetical protein DRN74_01240 [Candidatus Micrarchaeota archaeon]|nr:MAG: hypothetical protein DRN74_01240 [Candidatus Micrarchaeota archaeon]